MFNFKKKKIAEDAQLIIDIVNNYASNSSIKKMISPISDEYFLLDKKNRISICIGDSVVTFSNHVYLYKKSFNLSFTDSLKKTIKLKMEEEMQILKKSLFKNEINLLDKINGLSIQKEKPLIIRHNFKSS